MGEEVRQDMSRCGVPRRRSAGVLRFTIIVNGTTVKVWGDWWIYVEFCGPKASQYR
ncbi:hypothetical protein BD310DRAFT_918253 [Dichomitus squalens]|uniref:Uncharacterized protein n=1 Tax=Dichomitus squalens TaxID=114155 RepID=A0A4Q9Q775_9APHY|nr:hypothetical protein BD310DRAFT_918253 [Dichomitus squalens]